MSEVLVQNHFELFGLPVDFTVDAERLGERYRELQRSVHPDRFASGSDQERRLSMQRAAQINEAYRALKDPLARARYLLELNGVAMDDQNNTVMDPEFLMEQMELREALGDVRGRDNPMVETARLIGTIKHKMTALTRELEGLFADGGDLEGARERVLKLQFFNKLRNEAMDLEAELEDELA